MKNLVRTWLIIALFSLIQVTVAEEIPGNKAEIPTLEQDFVKTIHKFTKAEIIEQLGDPAQADDVKVKGSGKVAASIWQYHYINTDDDGTYYETTELDFIDDKVVMVAFMNNDGAEGPESGKKYELPK